MLLQAIVVQLSAHLSCDTL